MSKLRIDEDNLKNGILTLVVTLVEIIQEALEAQAVRRLEGGSLTVEEQDRLGNALLELDEAMAQLKRDHGIVESVDELRRGLDDAVYELVDTELAGRAANSGRADTDLAGRPANSGRADIESGGWAANSGRAHELRGGLR